jgi:hypothetical protein
MDSLESFINPYWYRGIGVRKMRYPNTLFIKNKNKGNVQSPMNPSAHRGNEGRVSADGKVLYLREDVEGSFLIVDWKNKPIDKETWAKLYMERKIWFLDREMKMELGWSGARTGWYVNKTGLEILKQAGYVLVIKTLEDIKKEFSNKINQPTREAPMEEPYWKGDY